MTTQQGPQGWATKGASNNGHSDYTTSGVQAWQRFSPSHPCPICQGTQRDPSGKGRRCYGFMSEDGEWAHCTRGEHAGQIIAKGDTYAHKMHGLCRCGVTHGEARTSSAHAKASSKGDGKVTRYEIRDVAGELQAIHVRTDYSDGTKSNIFPWERPGGIKGLGGLPVTSLPFYGSHELKDHPAHSPVYLAEGEKARDALKRMGLCALGTITGAKDTGGDLAAPEILATLKGRDAILWPDNDQVGMAHMRRHAEALKGTARSVRFIRWPDAPPKGDAFDFAANGGKAEQLTAMVSDTLEDPQAAEYLTADAFMAQEFPEPRWIMPGIIPEGLTVLSGKPKHGKSWLLLTLAIAKACGGPFLNGTRLEAAPVLYLALEDAPARLQDRMKILLAGARAPKGLQLQNAKDDEHWHMARGGLDHMAAWLAAHPGGCIIVDTFARIRPRAKSNANAYQEDYDAVRALKSIADEHGGAIILVMHNRKAAADDPFDEINASTGIAGAYDTGITLQRKRGEADAVLNMASRLGPDCQLALTFDGATCLWRSVGDAAEYAMSKERREIYEAIRQLGKASPKQLAEMLDLKPGVVYKRLHDMEQAGQVQSSERGLYTIGMNGMDGKYGKDVRAGMDDEANHTTHTDHTYHTNHTNLTDVRESQGNADILDTAPHVNASGGACTKAPSGKHHWVPDSAPGYEHCAHQCGTKRRAVA